MEKIKLNIEINKEVYEAIKQQYEEMQTKLQSKMPCHTVDEFIVSIIDSYAKSGEQMKKLGNKLSDVLEMFGGDLNNLGDVDFGSIFSNKDAKKKESDKKSEPPKNTGNLKN